MSGLAREAVGRERRWGVRGGVRVRVGGVRKKKRRESGEGAKSNKKYLDKRLYYVYNITEKGYRHI